MKEQEATAGFRNAGWTMGQLPHGSAVSVHPLSTADGAAVNGLLYTNGRSDVVACIMHPREFLASHYLVPELLVAGYSVFTQTSRAVDPTFASSMRSRCLMLQLDSDFFETPASARSS